VHLRGSLLFRPFHAVFEPEPILRGDGEVYGSKENIMDGYDEELNDELSENSP